MEEENKKKNKISLSTYILVLALLIIAVMAVFIYMQKVNANREIEGLKNDTEELKSTVIELQGKQDSTSDILNTTDNNQEKSTTNENYFSIYQSNFEKAYNSIIEKAATDGCDIEKFVQADQNKGIVVDKDGNAYYGGENFGRDNNKIDSNVLKAYYCKVGQDSADIVLIHKDGSAYRIKDAIYPDTKMEAKKIDNAKDIVDVISVLESDELDGGFTYYLVDINGNIIDVNK